MKKTEMTLTNIHDRAAVLADILLDDVIRGEGNTKGDLLVYAIPRGGYPAAYAVQAAYEAIRGALNKLRLVSNPAEAHYFLDDIIDSGTTMERYCDEYPGRPFFALVDKTDERDAGLGWVVFPWEQREDGTEETAHDNIVRLLQLVGENPEREGLRETPARVVKAWAHWCSGYGKDPAEVMKVFKDGGEKYDQMVVVRDIPFYSHCEHHMAPFFGTATIGYIPDGKIVGLSKLSRVLDIFARRLQVQERLTRQVADCLHAELNALGVGVVIKARHLCMESRGVSKQGHYTVTSALLGAMKEEQATREEFMALCRDGSPV